MRDKNPGKLGARKIAEEHLKYHREMMGYDKSTVPVKPTLLKTINTDKDTNEEWSNFPSIPPC